MAMYFLFTKIISYYEAFFFLFNLRSTEHISSAQSTQLGAETEDEGKIKTNCNVLSSTQ